MKIGLTGGTGFVGHYIARQLLTEGNSLRCWARPSSDRSGIDAAAGALEWLDGELGDAKACAALVDGCDAVVHSGLYHPGGGFRAQEGQVEEFVARNVLGTIQLIEAARRAGVKRFIFISSCAVHEKVLDDRPLDETHPLWSTSHYGAHKAAIEKFVHSYGFGQGYPICALRPTGVYGVARPLSHSKWHDLVKAVVEGRDVECERGGKEVHAADVAKAVGVLLAAPDISGQAYACYDRYISQFEVATLAKRLAASSSQIRGRATTPKNQIVTEKIRALGMRFGGLPLLEATIRELVDAIRAA